MHDLIDALRVFILDEEGATAVEYGLMLVLIAAVIIGTVKAVGLKVDGVFTDFNTKAAAAGM
ncbi:MAG: Flp family type IVb pilin [Gemmatimonadaceae bacterium]